MIHPEALIIDLEPEGFSRLSEIVSKGLYSSRPEIHLLHASGRVTNVVHTR